MERKLTEVTRGLLVDLVKECAARATATEKAGKITHPRPTLATRRGPQTGGPVDLAVVMRALSMRKKVNGVTDEDDLDG